MASIGETDKGRQQSEAATEGAIPQETSTRCVGIVKSPEILSSRKPKDMME